ncbi:MAG: RdgB/HAM1 family non-canonical purine NTP pyrophosphatase [Fibrobacteres bacterium]|nr:RdgB/HAM1 family non-canonical purine NTP pyrophosphatase [Fibrobacterota bacterium]
MILDTLVIATGNRHKVNEISQILSGLSISLKTLKDFPLVGEIKEDAPDFKGNALIKAHTVMKHTGLPSLADDSGLEVDALDGAPGVLSARFSGGNDADNNALLLQKLQGLTPEKRTARFRCVIALTIPGEPPVFAEGKIDGRIIEKESGANGFGYDPLFVPDGYNKTFAEIESAEKNKISHRGRALHMLSRLLTEKLCC